MHLGAHRCLYRHLPHLPKAKMLSRCPFRTTTTTTPVPKKPFASWYDYRLIALTPIIMKCLERLIMHHIISYLSSRLHWIATSLHIGPTARLTMPSPLYLHSALIHLDTTDPHVRMLLIDFSSAFNTIIPKQLVLKLAWLGLKTSLCSWLLSDGETTGSLGRQQHLQHHYAGHRVSPQGSFNLLLLPSERRLQSSRGQTNRLKGSFFY